MASKYQTCGCLCIDSDSGRFIVAHKPSFKPVVGDSLVHRALETKAGYSWRQVGKNECVRRLSVNSGIYVPLVTKGKELGFVCVENTDNEFFEWELEALSLIALLISPQIRSPSVKH